MRVLQQKAFQTEIISQELSFAFLDVPDRLADDRFLHPSNWASMNPCWRGSKSVLSITSRTGKAVTKVTGAKWFGERYFASCCVTGAKKESCCSGLRLCLPTPHTQACPPIPVACIFTLGGFFSSWSG